LNRASSVGRLNPVRCLLEARDRAADTLSMKLRSLPATSAWLGAVCLLLSGCGNTQGHPPSTAGSTASAVPRAASATGSSGGSPAASHAPSRAQALAFARTVNLIASDIPEASVEAKHGHDSDASEKREYRACERLAGSGKRYTIAEASSPKLRRGQELEAEQITSSVTVLSDERAVAHQFALLGSAALRKCGARALTHNIDDKSIRDARWGRVTVSKLPVHAPGSSATFGMRIVAKLNLSFSEVSVPIYVDVLGFAMGRAEVALTAMSATQPVPTSTEQELLGLLLAGARAHPL
jgi:hypothetical protein